MIYKDTQCATTKYGIAEHGLKQLLVNEQLLNCVRSIEIEILKRLIDVCESNDLSVVMMYGSLLGVIRGDSMIPGDDDIDVAMPRKDFDRLIELNKDNNLFGNDLFLQTPANDSCFYGGYCKLRKSDTTAIHPQNWWVDCNEGIGIDIFPLDYGYIDAQKEKRKRKKIIFLQRLLYAKNYGYFREFKDMPMLKWKAYKYIGKLYKKQQIVDRFNRLLRSSDFDRVEREHTLIDKIPYGIYTHYNGVSCGRFFPADSCDELIKASYEGISVKIPKGWDSILNSLYGCGYLIPENSDKDKIFHGFYATDVPYAKYKRRFNGLCRPIPERNRRIVLVGNTEIAEQFKKRYKPVNQIVYIDSDDAGENFSNKLCCDLTASDYVVICAYDVRDTEHKLRMEGIKDYYIFWYEREWMLLESMEPIKD